jgi:cell division protease FtsH
LSAKNEIRKRSEGRTSSRKPRGALLLAAAIGAAVLVTVVARNDVSDRAVVGNFSQVVELLDAGLLDPANLEYVEGEHCFRGKIIRAAGDEGPRRFELRLGGAEMDRRVFAEFERYNGQFKGDTARMLWPKSVKSSAAVWNNLLTLLPWVLFAFIIYFVFIRQLRGGGAAGNPFAFGKSHARLATKERPSVTFEDVAGIEEAKGDVREIIEFLRNPGRFQKLGGRIPRGVMLIGSPGTGKTLLAKAIAGEADVPFFSICGSDFVEMFVGVGASRVRDLFRQARENSPCILFLDEIDAVGRKRGSGITGGHDEREQTLNAILVEMDGFNSDEGIIVIAATNRPDVLDPALLRPGRFDREIAIDLPDLKGREEILLVHTRKVKLDPSTDLHRIARATATFSGAELAALVNEAAIIAALNDQPAVTERDLEEARDKIRWGRQKKSRVLSVEDRRITAYHEAGHALVAQLLPEAEPIHKVTIIPRGMALGSTMQLPERDRYHLSRRQVIATMTVLFAGRAAEEIAMDDVTAGARNDIERASELARLMVCEWGMSEAVGPIHFPAGEEGVPGSGPRRRQWSDATAIRIDEEVRRIVDGCHEACRRMVREHRDALERITQALLLKETVTGEEVKLLIEGGEIELPAPLARAPEAAEGGKEAHVPPGKASHGPAPEPLSKLMPKRATS